jgi:hypothetical protein
LVSFRPEKPKRWLPKNVILRVPEKPRIAFAVQNDEVQKLSSTLPIASGKSDRKNHPLHGPHCPSEKLTTPVKNE